ncbi:MAG: biotin transporter BioY [Holosporaceae bacterium]|nr:MAG: biotin transporter BioY [Holosporaceae bacterium]
MNYTHLIKNVDTKPVLIYLAKIVIGSLFIAASAQVSIPFYPVPITLQPAALMFLGLIARPSVAMGAVGLYLFEASIGLPVLSNFSGGPAHLLGTRGGFILAFLPLASITSYVSRLYNTVWSQILGCTLGNVALYGSGVLWLSHFIGLSQALQFGLYPFILQIPLYIVLAILSARTIKLYKK